MAMVTATQVTVYTDISVSAATITTSGFIPIVQDRITDYCYNWFVSKDINFQGTLTFTATDSIAAGTGNNWVSFGFADGDEVYLYGSRRNDGYYDVTSVTTVIMTVDSTNTVVDELSGASILVSLVEWPGSLAYAAAQMVKYDYDDRKTRAAGLTSQSLGPRSESYAAETGVFGYPLEILGILDQYRVARLM